MWAVEPQLCNEPWILGLFFCHWCQSRPSAGLSATPLGSVYCSHSIYLQISQIRSWFIIGVVQLVIDSSKVTMITNKHNKTTQWTKKGKKNWMTTKRVSHCFQSECLFYVPCWSDQKSFTCMCQREVQKALINNYDVRLEWLEGVGTNKYILPTPF